MLGPTGIGIHPSIEMDGFENCSNEIKQKTLKNAAFYVIVEWLKNILFEPRPDITRSTCVIKDFLYAICMSIHGTHQCRLTENAVNKNNVFF